MLRVNSILHTNDPLPRPLTTFILYIKIGNPFNYTALYCFHANMQVTLDIPYASPPQGTKYFTIIGPHIDCMDEQYLVSVSADQMSPVVPKLRWYSYVGWWVNTYRCFVLRTVSRVQFRILPPTQYVSYDYEWLVNNKWNEKKTQMRYSKICATR